MFVHISLITALEIHGDANFQYYSEPINQRCGADRGNTQACGFQTPCRTWNNKYVKLALPRAFAVIFRYFKYIFWNNKLKRNRFLRYVKKL